MVLTYKYKLRGRYARRQLSVYAKTINDVWNYCVETQKKVNKLYRQGLGIKWPSRFDFANLTVGTSKKLNINAKTIQATCEQFVKSRDQHQKCPKFRKSYTSKRSLGWIPFTNQSRQIINSNIVYLGKTYKFFGAQSRPLPNIIKGGCFVEDSRSRWYVCLHVEIPEDNIHGNKEIGVDLGLKDLVTTSDGDKYKNPTFYRKLEQKLKTAHRANNKNRVRAICNKIKNQRKDYLHKLSNKLVRESKLIVVGNVKSSKLAKTRMAKSVYDAGWYAFREMLRYKASRHGVKYLETNEAFTTQTCSTCGQRPPERPKGIAGLGIREWVCSLCGTHHDRDVNAAKNILNLGRGTPPPVEESRADLNVS